MIRQTIRLAAVLTAYCLAAVAPLYAGLPTEQVRETTNQMLAALDDPALSGPANANALRRRLITVTDERIDWEALSKSCLGLHWRDRSTEEKKEFVPLLTEFLQTVNADAIIENFSNLREVQYVDERIDGKYATVRINLVTKEKTEIPVIYRMKSAGDDSGWEIFDIIVEGISMIKTYRAQFDDIIRKGSYADLVEKLKERIAEQKKAKSAPEG